MLTTSTSAVQTEMFPVSFVALGILFFVLAGGAPLVGAKLRLVIPTRTKSVTVGAGVVSLAGLLGLAALVSETIALGA